VVGVITAILLYFKLAGLGPPHPVFFYLLPIAAVAVLGGTWPALLSAAAAMLCAAFFLYDPIFSFYIVRQLELGDLICFGVLAAIGVKCTTELMRPVTKIAATKSRGG